MNEPINWLEVIMDYGKRFPTATMESLGFVVDISARYLPFRKLKRYGNSIRFDSSTYYTVYFRNFNNNISYFKSYGDTLAFVRIDDNILLRLLTDGKEDLI